GKEDGKADAYREELDGLASLIAREKELDQAICNPLYDTQGRKNVLKAIIEKLDLSKVMTAFLLLLFDKGRIGFISDINDFYQKLADELKGIARASLVSATEISSGTIEKIRMTLSKKTGKDIILEVEQDPGLIGGESLKRGESV
ncbi:MAG: ATP synthase F1 subunit delta, partial [Deltaproteobacteria bacterium]|nr:ATP synthase F1 subunit delta [Deltaproteobacteria bacterium]